MLLIMKFFFFFCSLIPFYMFVIAQLWKHIKSHLPYGIYTNITLNKPLIICILWAVRSVLSVCWRFISSWFHLITFTWITSESFISQNITCCKSCVFLGSLCGSFMYLKSTFYQRRRSSLAERFTFKGNTLMWCLTQPDNREGLTLILGA